VTAIEGEQMQNRFGVKDLVILVLLLAVGVGVWLSMVQADRQHDDLRSLVRSVETIDRQINRLQGTLDSGVVARGPAGTDAPGAPASARDESWARPGVPVTWAEPFAFTNDPRDAEGYAEGGEFVEILEGQPPIITPYRYADTYGRRINELVCESLGKFDPETLELKGLLAAAWQYDPNGLWLRALIQPAARFSDGEPVTAADVKYTLESVLRNPEIEAERFRSVYTSIKGVEVIAPKVVEFSFHEPRFNNRSQAFTLRILPKHFFERFAPTQINQGTGLLIGSGPFKLANLDPTDQWKPPQDVVLVRNEAYWGPRPAVASYRFKTVQESVARLTTYTNGGGDLVRPTAQQIDGKRKDAEFLKLHRDLVWYNMQGGWSFIAWQCGERAGKATPFRDKRVRLAMTHLIDRERILRDIFKGLARIATGPFNGETPQANPAIKPWPYDPDRARELLAEAGWLDRDGDGVLEDEARNPFVFELTFAQGNDSTLQMVTYVKDQCGKVGIRCQLRPVDWSILQTLLNSRDFDALTMAWSASDPESDPRQLWHSTAIQNQGDNFAQWNDPQADRLIEQGVATIDDAQRMLVWHQLHSRIHEEAPYTPLLELPYLRFNTRRTGNVHTYKSGLEVQEFFLTPSGDPGSRATAQ